MKKTSLSTQAMPPPSELVIPAVPGEFYSYQASFSFDRPLYCAMKCKANKARPIENAHRLVNEIDLVFHFGIRKVSSPSAEESMRLISDIVGGALLNRTHVAPANLTEDEFNRIRNEQDQTRLVEVGKTAEGQITSLEQGSLIAFRTESGKHGLFQVKSITPGSIEIDACHILL